MVSNIISCLVVWLIFSFHAELIAQVSPVNKEKQNMLLESGFFNRPSITIVPLSLNNSNHELLLSQANRAQFTAGARFDYNFVDTESLIRTQQSFLRQRFFVDSIDKPENIQALLVAVRQSGLLEKIINQAANLDSLNARKKRMERRLVTSASAQQNITVVKQEEIFALVNGAFIGFPVLTTLAFNPREPDNMQAKGFVYWVRLEVPPLSAWKGNFPSPDQVTLIPAGVRRARGGAIRTSTETEIALKTEALAPFVQELFDEASAISALKPRATIQSVLDGIRLDVGDREGVYLDQGYEIFETLMDEKGNRSSIRKGFVRVNSVAANQQKMDALSSAYPVSFGGFDIGMSAVAHDQLIDIVLRPEFSFLTIPQASINSFLGANLVSGSATASYNLHASLLVNMARTIGIPQFFLGIDGGIGIINVGLNSGQQTQQGSNTPISINQPMMYEASLLALKKFWFGGLAGFVEANVGINSVSISGQFGGTEWSLNYGSLLLAAGAKAGLEVALSPDMILGFEAGYRAVLPVTEVNLQSAESQVAQYTQTSHPQLWQRSDLNNVSLSGLRGALRLTISIPSF